MANNTGRIILFPVPMGDVPPARVLPAYNLELLRGVRRFVVENVRSARRFLRAADKSFDIDACTFCELSEHTSRGDVSAMIAPALEGHDIGVISEAGCPAVADPGADIVALAQRMNITVVPLVGPSSIIMSLMASGFNGQNFTFEGYLPIEAPKRTEKLKEMERDCARCNRTHIFIETPYRNIRLVEQMTKTLPRHALLCIASDISGPDERIRTMSMADWAKTDYSYIDRRPTIFLIGGQ